jgi:hypothetical protein
MRRRPRRNVPVVFGVMSNRTKAPHVEREAQEAPLEGGSRDKGFSEVTGGRAPSFRDLSAGEALVPAPQERENSGGGKFPSQISHRKDQAGSLGTKE